MASRRRTPEVDALEHAGKGTDKTSKLDVKYINTFKGRGVFATATFLKGEFVVEYRGDLIDSKEEERRRKLYHAKSVVFMFGFRWREKTWCIDASREDGSFGRLVNDDHLHPNCKMKKMISEGKPHLFLFALRDILPGEEITYNYGGSDWPWRKKAGEPTPSVTALSDADVSRNTDQDSQSSEATLNQAGEPTPSVTALSDADVSRNTDQDSQSSEATLNQAGEPTPSVTALSDADVSRNTDQDSQSSEATLNQAGEPTPSVTALSDADVSRNTDQDSQSSEATLNQLDTSSGQKSELMETLISYEDIESDKGDE
ncbi:uncharacterized protein ACNS7B_003506 [Menidia menidia]